MNEFFIIFEGGFKLIITFLIALTCFSLLLFINFSKIRKFLWILYLLTAVLSACSWKDFFFPVSESGLLIFSVPVLIGWIFFVFSSVVFLIGLKNQEKFFQNMGGVAMIISGAVVIIFTATSIFYIDAKREENYKRQMLELEMISDFRQELDLQFPNEELVDKTAEVVPGSSLCRTLGVIPQEAVKIAKINKLKYYWQGYKLFVLVHPGDTFTQVGEIWILNEKK